MKLDLIFLLIMGCFVSFFSGFSTSHYTTRLLPHLLRFCVATCLVIGSVYSYSLVRGEYVFSQAAQLAEQDQLAWAYVGYQEAVAIYPGSRERAAIAQIYSQLPGIHPDIAVAAVQTALDSDPLSAVFLAHYSLHQSRRGDIEAVRGAYETLTRYFPEYGETEFVRQLIEEPE